MGSALLYVETQRKTLLYAPAMQTAVVPHVRPLYLRHADTLILGTHHASLHYPVPDREQERTRLEAALGAVRQRVKIFCASIGTAQEVTALAAAQQLAVSVHPTIATVNRVYRDFGVELGDYRVFDKRRDNWQVLILPCSLANSPHTRRLAARTFHIYDTYPPPPIIAPPDEAFYLSRVCTGVELRQIVTKLRPREIFTCGDYAKSYGDALRDLCANIRPLFAGNQPTLF